MRMIVSKNLPSIHTLRPALMFCLLLSLAGCCRTSGWVMNNSGMGYYQKGNYSMARNEFERAVIDQPYNPDYRHNLAMAQQQRRGMAGTRPLEFSAAGGQPADDPGGECLA